MNDKREELVQRLNKAVVDLYQVKEERLDVRAVLQQSINENADEETFNKIIADIENYVYLRKMQPDKFR